MTFYAGTMLCKITLLQLAVTSFRRASTLMGVVDHHAMWEAAALRVVYCAQESDWQ